MRPMTDYYLMSRLFVKLALLSRVVIAETEYNYVNITKLNQTHTAVAGTIPTDEQAQVCLVVRNAINEQLRILHTYIKTVWIVRMEHIDTTSIQFLGYRTFPVERRIFPVSMPEHQLTENLLSGNMVKIYNDYESEIPITRPEVML